MIRPITAILVTSVLMGCATSSDTARDTPADDGFDLQTMAAVIAGDYVSVRQPGEIMEMVRLSVDPEPAAPGILLVLTQHRADSQRVFELYLTPTDSDDRFDGRFIPLRADRGRAGPACDMRFRLAAGRLVGETDPGTCRFRSEGWEIGLLKEIAFDGASVLMADQLLLEDGTPFAEQDRLELARIVHFSGTLAQRDGQAWRAARNLRVSAGGNLVEPLDAAGMSLGLLLNLELMSRSGSDTPALRLQVLEEGSGRAMAEVWNSFNADLIGLALDDLRLELQRESAGFPVP